MTCRHYAVMADGGIRCRDCGDRYDWTLDGARWLGKPTKRPERAPETPPQGG